MSPAAIVADAASVVTIAVSAWAALSARAYRRRAEAVLARAQAARAASARLRNARRTDGAP